MKFLDGMHPGARGHKLLNSKRQEQGLGYTLSVSSS